MATDAAAMADSFPLHGTDMTDQEALNALAGRIEEMLAEGEISIDSYGRGVADTLRWLAEGHTDSRDLTATILSATLEV